jgi:hypothetical protein
MTLGPREFWSRTAKSRSQVDDWLRGDLLIGSNCSTPSRSDSTYHINQPNSPPLLDRGLAKPPVPEPLRERHTRPGPGHASKVALR